MDTIGISGPSGSGKSLLAQVLASLLPGCQVLCTDSYYRDLAGISPARRALVNFDAPSALDWDLFLRHVRRLGEGGEVEAPLYDFATHTRAGASHTVHPCGALVLEGLFALCDPRIRELLDLAVFLDVPEEVCFARRLARDIKRRGRTEASVAAQWRRDVWPMFRRHILPTREHADVVIDGSRPPIESGMAVRDALRGKRALQIPRSIHSN